MPPKINFYIRSYKRPRVKNEVQQLNTGDFTFRSIIAGHDKILHILVKANVIIHKVYSLYSDNFIT